MLGRKFQRRKIDSHVKRELAAWTRVRKRGHGTKSDGELVTQAWHLKRLAHDNSGELAAWTHVRKRGHGTKVSLFTKPTQVRR